MHAIINRSLTEFLAGVTGYLAMPEFQREYCWGKEQCENLLRSILSSKNAGQLSEKHLIGSILYEQPATTMIGRANVFGIIDGQQRITTVSLLQLAVYSFLCQNFSKIPDALAFQNGVLGCVSYVEPTTGNRRPKLILTTTNSDKAVYEDLYTHAITSAPLVSPPDHNLVKNFKYLLNSISFNNYEDYLKGVSNLSFIEVNVGNAYVKTQDVFDSLNTTGVKLKTKDLIRNFVLLQLGYPSCNLIYSNTWVPMEARIGQNSLEDLYYHFCSSKATTKPEPNKLYSVFKDVSKSLSATTIVTELDYYSKLYKIVLNPQIDDVQSLLTPISATSNQVNVVVNCIQSLRALDFSRSIDGLIVELLKSLILNKITIIEFKELVDCIEAYVVRRAVLNRPARRYPNIFFKLLKTVQKAITSNLVNSAFVSCFNTDFLNEISSYTGYSKPTDLEFKTGLSVTNAYHVDWTAFILNKIANWGKPSHVPINWHLGPQSVYTIEHVLPQIDPLPVDWQNMLGADYANIQKRCLHKIGNLTIVHSNSNLGVLPYNSTNGSNKLLSAQNKEGRNVSLSSQIVPNLSDEFTGSNIDVQWTDIEIDKRTDRLISLCLSIWP